MRLHCAGDLIGVFDGHKVRDDLGAVFGTVIVALGGARTPKSNRDYWAKITRNATRDVLNRERLQDVGWSVLTLWECELKDEAGVAVRLRSFLT